MLETQLKRNRKGNSLFYYSPLHLSSMMLPYCHDITFLSSIPFGHDYVIMLYLHTLLLLDVSQPLNWLSSTLNVTNFIRPYLHQFFDYSHGLKASLKPFKRPFDRYQSRLEAISIGRDIRQINW